jgi:formylmethanofuran dehydrogenase subunit E
MADQQRCDYCGKFINPLKASALNDDVVCLDCYEENCVLIPPKEDDD